jgi:endonuclease/exonuclease/phosphatase family metal-dependent hydrolase
MWLLMSVTLFLCIHPVAAWSDCGYSGDDPRGTELPELPDKPYPDDGILDLDRLNDNETLRLGAFNIQVFGKSKAAKPEVMEVLGKIIRTYDLVAIQEIRDKSQTALPVLVDVVNANNSAPYDYVVSERLGRTSSKEQYAYIYNNQTVELTCTPHTYPEPYGTDPFHREPYIASFRVLDGNFDATLITIHADPDEATEEINALDDVVRYAQSTYPDEQDFIVMGDLNADCSYFDEDSNSTMHGSDYYWCINNSVDTTTKSTNCTYDRIIITNPAVPDFAGAADVFRFDLEYGLNVSETTAVSDHYPVYAEFWRGRDADPDKAPEVVDAVIALQIAVGSREYDPELDVNGDGRVTSLDALMILQAASV